MAAEPCAGCGIYADPHPMVHIEHDDASDERVSVPVCDDCWKDPAHRTRRALRGAFHLLKDAPSALAASKRLLKQSRAGENIGVSL